MKIRISEHQKIFIQRQRDSDKPSITDIDAKKIKKIEDINKKSIFRWNYDAVAPTQYIGTISLPGLDIEIFPKIINSEDSQGNIKALFDMLNVAYEIPKINNIESSASFAENGFFDIIASLFIKRVNYEIIEGINLDYNKIEWNIPKIKGKIVYEEHVQKNYPFETKFYCRHSIRSNDTEINQLIKLTLKIIAILSKSNDIKIGAKSLLSYFDGVKDISIECAQNIDIIFNRLTSRFGDLIRYAKLILGGQYAQFGSGQNSVSSFLFDMNILFEKFIYKSLRQIPDFRVHYQYHLEHLIEQEESRRKLIELKPDFLIHHANDIVIADTKWKVMGDFIEESDAYQINAYCSVTDNLKKGLLLYPKNSRNDRNTGNYRLCSNSGIIGIRTVDLSLTGRKKIFQEHLKNVILD